MTSTHNPAEGQERIDLELLELMMPRFNALQLSQQQIPLQDEWRDIMESAKRVLSMQLPEYQVTAVYPPIHRPIQEHEHMDDKLPDLLREILEEIQPRYGEVLPCILSSYGQNTVILLHDLLDGEWMIHWMNETIVYTLAEHFEQTNLEGRAWEKLVDSLVERSGKQPEEFNLRLHLTGRTGQELLDGLEGMLDVFRGTSLVDRSTLIEQLREHSIISVEQP